MGEGRHRVTWLCGAMRARCPQAVPCLTPSHPTASQAPPSAPSTWQMWNVPLRDPLLTPAVPQPRGPQYPRSACPNPGTPLCVSITTSHHPYSYVPITISPLVYPDVSRPGCCAGMGSAAAIVSSGDIPDETLSFAKEHPLLHGVVAPAGGRPLFTQTGTR